MSELIGFEKNDETIRSGGDLEYYRGEKNRTDLLSICWFFQDDEGNYQMSEDDTPKFIAEKIHYVQGMGYVQDNDYLRDKLGPPKRKVGTFVVHYKTDDDGNLQKPFDYTVKPWTFGEDKYRQLAELHKELPLTTHDVKVVCTDDQFQKLTFYPKSEGAVWQKKDEIKDEVLTRVESIEDRLSIGREVDMDELKDHFGDETSPAPDVSSEVDYDELMDGIE